MNVETEILKAVALADLTVRYVWWFMLIVLAVFVVCLAVCKILKRKRRV